MCKKCSGQMCNAAIGIGTECGHSVSSQGLKYCVACSQTLKKCQACGAALTGARKVSPRAPKNNQIGSSRKTIIKSFAAVERIKTNFVTKYWSDESGIIGVGVGRKDGQFCIDVFILNKESAAQLPERYRGVAIIYTVTDLIVAL